MSQSPSIAYPGGKARLAEEIIALLPRHGRNYIEPFVGRGNLFWSAASAGLKYERWWLNDIATIPFFHAIKEIGDVIEVPEHSRAEYECQHAASKRGDSTALLLEPL
jgi:site-specific DNA-adenine methylase